MTVQHGTRADQPGPTLRIETAQTDRYRHGTSLTARLSQLLAPFANVPAGSVLDRELVSIAERANRPVQDFAAVGVRGHRPETPAVSVPAGLQLGVDQAQA